MYRPNVLLAISAFAALALCSAWLFFSGSKLGTPAAFAVAALPVIVYFVIVRPVALPYALYAFLLPFDNLLMFSSSGTITKFIGMAATATIFLWAVRNNRLTAPPRSVFFGLLYIIWLCASLFWAQRFDLGMQILPTYVGLFLLYAVLSMSHIEWRDLKLIFAALISGTIIAAAYGLHVFRDQSATQATALKQEFGRMALMANDSSIDPNHFSDAMLLPFALLLVVALRTRLGLAKFAAVLGLLVILAAIDVSASREAILSIGVILLYLIIRSRYRLQLLFVALIGVAGIAAAPSVLLQRFAQAQASGGSGRMAIWRVGFAAFRKHWFAGAGVGNYKEVYDTVFIQVYQAYSGGWSRVAHNLIVQTSAEVGVVGLILVLVFWASHFWMMRDVRHDHPLYDYRIALEAGLVALFFASMFIDLIWYKYLWMAFSCVVQLRVVAYARVAARPIQARVAQWRAPAFARE